MKHTKKKMLNKVSICAIAAASMAFTACDYLNTLLPPDQNDPPIITPPVASSSSFKVQSSSAIVPPNGQFQTWYGFTGEAQIQTGLGNETLTSGYWYTYDDTGEGGKSHIIWPTALGNDYSDDALDPVILHCNGLCGTAVLDKGSMTYHPFVGAAFNLVGETSAADPTPAAGDASSMGGICITYSSDIAPTLQMGLGDAVEASIGYALPAASLPKSVNGITKHIAWSDFKQPTWYKGGVTFSGPEAAKQLVNLKFNMQAAPGSYNFNIMAIGPYGGCEQTTIPPIDPPNPIDPPKPPTPGKFQTWFGSNGEYKIYTGYDNGSETSGYWYSYGDDIDGGLSQIIWPVEMNNGFFEDAMDPIIEYCGGLCGIAHLDKGNLMYNPFIGVGFNIAGEGPDGTPTAANASDMGGVCITYKSDIAPMLEMGLGDAVDATIGYAQPYVSLPKSSSMETTKFLKWSDFKQPSWYKGDVKISGEEAAKILVSLKFRLQGASGEYDFNILSIGPYNGGSCAPYPIRITTNN